MNKKIISLILFLIGLVSIILGLVFSGPSDVSDTKKPIIKPNPDSNNQENEVTQPEFILTINKFIVEKNKSNEVNINIDVLNDTTEKISSKILYLNFYQDDDLLYTYLYEIQEMDEGDTITIESVLNFPYENITRYEFEYEGIKKNIEPIN